MDGVCDARFSSTLSVCITLCAKKVWSVDGVGNIAQQSGGGGNRRRIAGFLARLSCRLDIITLQRFKGYSCKDASWPSPTIPTCVHVYMDAYQEDACSDRNSTNRANFTYKRYDEIPY